MAFPSNWTLVAVRGRFLGTDGKAIRGMVKFTPDAPRVVNVDQTMVLVGDTFTVALDANGEFKIELPATDDTDIAPTGWTYKVSEDFPGGINYNIEVPAASAGTGLDLSTVAPVPGYEGQMPEVTMPEFLMVRDQTYDARDAADEAASAAVFAQEQAEAARDEAVAVNNPLTFRGLLAMAENRTGVQTNTNEGGVAIPGCVITVQPSSRPVWLSWGLVFGITTAANGRLGSLIYDLTDGGATLINAPYQVVGATTHPAGFFGGVHQMTTEVGPLSTMRTYGLYINHTTGLQAYAFNQNNGSGRSYIMAEAK